MDFTCTGNHLLIRLLVALLSAVVPLIILIAVGWERVNGLNREVTPTVAGSGVGYGIVLFCLAAFNLIVVLMIYGSMGSARPVRYDSHQTLQNMLLVPAAVAVFIGRRYVMVRNRSGLASHAMKVVYVALVVAAVLFAALVLQMLSHGCDLRSFWD